MPRPKDNVALVCDIGELAGLFEKSAHIEDFLRNAASIVAYHMKAAVCSIYLYNEGERALVLTANQGLNPDAVGRVRLQPGEGLVGTVFSEQRPIREASAARNPRFKFVPGTNEERYEAFLAVPIIRGLSPVGVLVVQDPVPGYFDENDSRAMQTIAAQLASVIQNAKLLMNLRRQPPEAAAVAAPPGLRYVKGAPVSDGCAYGKATVLGVFEDQGQPGPFTADDFRRALARTEAQLADLQRAMEERLADVASMIFSAHLLMVKDSEFSGQMISLIEGGLSPQAAVAKVVGEYVRLFSSSPNARLREKVQDVRDLGRRLVQNLREGPESAPDYQGRILIAGELLASDIVKLAAQRAEGLLLIGGGITAHVSILARSLQLPAVVVEDRRFFGFPAGLPILIDGGQGVVLIDPGDEVLAKYRDLRAARGEAERFAVVGPEEAVTRDGVRVHVWANINILSEIDVARRMNVGGIGLYRSEFPFLVRNDFLAEEEQYRIYRKILDGMSGRPVVFRTLDIGGDKMLSEVPWVHEANPSLGLRGIRFSLQNKTTFMQQIRALLRAGAGADLRIMFPMVCSVEEFIGARDVVSECIRDLRTEDVPHHPDPKLGLMIEVPSAVEVAEELAAEADFLSIGSNDLVQYLLAVDRTNEHLSDLYLSHHPAVLRAMKRAADACLARGKPLSLCGEMAADPKMLPFVLGIGIRVLSVEVRQIPVLHKNIAGIRIEDAVRMAEGLLRMGRIQDIKTALGA
ncbi:MAG TPA: phosphoenolpyruvate--protein phosphotransferase [Verrucomicrobiae bacterium]|nr:phosphoenolpyruvate--protein phosphotransferase [Verrucomicrobiae bacterium]